MSEIDDLEEQVEEVKQSGSSLSSPRIWKPEPGDHVVGKVSGFDEINTEYGDRRVAVIQGKFKKEGWSESREGTIRVRLWHEQLIRKFDRNDLTDGDIVAIVRLEDLPGDRVKRYEVLTAEDLASAGDKTVEQSDVDGFLNE
jgi:exosome complex RNA-binding protein Csl4